MKKLILSLILLSITIPVFAGGEKPSLNKFSGYDDLFYKNKYELQRAYIKKLKLSYNHDLDNMQAEINGLKYERNNLESEVDFLRKTKPLFINRDVIKKVEVIKEKEIVPWWVLPITVSGWLFSFIF